MRMALAAVALAALASPAFAQIIPPGPIRIVAGFAAGGQTDVLARLVADKMGSALKRSIIVENRLGAGGGLAAEAVKNAAPDGATLLISNTVVMSLAALSTPGLRYAEADFAPILQVAEYPIGLATGPMTGARTLPELIAWLRANPDKANFAVPAAGSLPHLYGIVFADAAGLKVTTVPYRGGSPITTALAGGQLAAGLTAIGDFTEQHAGGGIRVVAVSGPDRNPVLADVPTFGQAGFRGLDESGWNGFFAPAGTPLDLVALYARVMTDALADPDVKRKLEALGLSVIVKSGPELARRIPAERERWRPVVKALNLGG